MFQTSFNFEVKSSYQHLGMSWACLKSFGLVSVAFAFAHFPFLTLLLIRHVGISYFSLFKCKTNLYD